MDLYFIMDLYPHCLLAMILQKVSYHLDIPLLLAIILFIWITRVILKSITQGMQG